MRNTWAMSSFICGHAPHHGACPHNNILLHFAKYFLFPIPTLVTCIQYTGPLLWLLIPNMKYHNPGVGAYTVLYPTCNCDNLGKLFLLFISHFFFFLFPISLTKTALGRPCIQFQSEGVFNFATFMHFYKLL